MDSPIRYLKLIGGPPDYESMLIGLKNGGVYQVFVNNAFPQLLAKQTGVIHCVDMNVDRTKVAVIDDTSTLYVYDVRTKELLFQVNEIACECSIHSMFVAASRNPMLKPWLGIHRILTCSPSPETGSSTSKCRIFLFTGRAYR